MAEDTVDHAAMIAGLPDKPCVTENLQLQGWRSPNAGSLPDWISVYGSDEEGVRELIAKDPALAKPIHPRLPHAMAAVVWGARHEMARTLEDVLSRRTRALLLDARAAIEAAPAVAAVLAAELGRDTVWAESQVKEFTALASGYLYRA
jgi:glycerol-3-phosphate dehydrogenase